MEYSVSQDYAHVALVPQFGRRKRRLVELMESECDSSRDRYESYYRKRRRSCDSLDDGYGENSNSSFKHKSRNVVNNRELEYRTRGNSCVDACCRGHRHHCQCRGHSDSGHETTLSTWARRRRSRRHGPRSRMLLGDDVDDRIKHPSVFESCRRRVLDDDEGHLIFKDGDVLHTRYQLGRVLGQGTFGKVVNCADLHNDCRPCVIKIMRKIPDYYDLAKIEVDILQKLNELDPDGRSGCVRMLDWFDHYGHICIVFERLGLSVYEFMKRNCFRPFTLDQVRSIAFQLCKTVKFCHDNKLTHTDLKPENVLFVDSAFDLSVDPTSRAARMKCRDYRRIRSTEVQVIDFGSATFEDDVHGNLVGTRQYRAPEVVLELDWSHPSDVWSLACVIFELYTGRTLFETHDTAEHLAIMERILGPMPQSIVAKRSRHFRKGSVKWSSRNSQGNKLRRRFKPLKSYMSFGTKKECQLFDLLSKMLEYKPSRRITLHDALKHPFFVDDKCTMNNNIARHFRNSSPCSHSNSSGRVCRSSS